MTVATEIETGKRIVVENVGAPGRPVTVTRDLLGAKWKSIPIRQAATIELANEKTDTLEEITVMTEHGTETEARGVKEEIEQIEEIEVKEAREVTETIEE
jgi:hypothetical protein